MNAARVGLAAAWTIFQLYTAQAGLYDLLIVVLLLPLPLFLRYGDWFRERFVPEWEASDVAHVERADGRFRLQTGAGGELEAGAVVVAVGVIPFPNQPSAFRAVTSSSKTSSHVARTTGAKTACAIRVPRVTTTGNHHADAFMGQLLLCECRRSARAF